ncbi:MAG: hypothetical protein ACREP9_16780, partial [Candidatus Dormibacteraceae bacterium]
MPPLDKLYRRLLFTYPDDYREQHEEEMIGTLLDVARPEQTCPSWRESICLIVGWLRTQARR